MITSFTLTPKSLVDAFDTLPCTATNPAKICRHKISDLKSDQSRQYIKDFFEKSIGVFSGRFPLCKRINDSFIPIFTCPENSLFRDGSLSVSVNSMSYVRDIYIKLWKGSEKSPDGTSIECTSNMLKPDPSIKCKFNSKGTEYKLEVDDNRCTETRTGKMHGLDRTSEKPAACTPGLPVLSEYLSSSPSPPIADVSNTQPSAWNWIKPGIGISGAAYCSYKAYQNYKLSQKTNSDDLSDQDKIAAQKRAKMYAAAAGASAVFAVATCLF